MKSKSLQRFWLLAKNTVIDFGDHNCPVMAAGMSFFGLLSIVPMTLLGASLLGYVLGSSSDAHQFVNRILAQNFPRSASAIIDQIDGIITSPQRALVNWLSAIGLIWSGMRFFNMLQRVLNSIWVGATQRWFLWERLAAFMCFVIAGLLFWLSFMLSSFIAAARELNIAIGGIRIGDVRFLWFLIGSMPQLIASTAMLFLLYLFVPHAKVSTKAALIGAGSASVIFEVFRIGFSFVMVKFDVYGRLYGPLASLIVFLSWLYLSMTIILAGAVLGSQVQEVLFTKNEGKAEGI